jgi:hypothetical protein
MFSSLLRMRPRRFEAHPDSLFFWVQADQMSANAVFNSSFPSMENYFEDESALLKMRKMFLYLDNTRNHCSCKDGVNCHHPGSVKNDLLGQLISGKDQKQKQTFSEKNRILHSRLPV